MRRLILVDCDNVLPTQEAENESRLLPEPVLQGRSFRWPGRLQEGAVADACTHHPGPDDTPPTVVVMASNARTIEAFSRASVADWGCFAAAIATQLLAEHEVPIAVAREICLVPVMPEAADTALVRLLREAPTQRHAGAFDEVVLVARDHGLREAVEYLLGPHFADAESQAGDRNGQADTVHRWQPRRGHRRGWSEPRVADEQRPLPHGWSVAIEEGHAYDAREKWVEAMRSLGDATRQAGWRPHVWSQIGVTLTSVRGVLRLDQRLAGASQVSALSVGETDGMELCNQRNEPPFYITASASIASTGAGAVHLRSDDKELTVGTALPPETVVQLGARSWRARRGHNTLWRLDDDLVLAALEKTIGLSTALGVETQVSIQARNRGTKWKVAPADPTVGPLAWWFDFHGPHGYRWVAARLGIGNDAVVGAVACVIARAGALDLALRAPIADDDAATVLVPPMHVGQIAVLDLFPEQQGARRVAFLETRPWRVIPPEGRQTVAIRAIQLAARPRLTALPPWLWDELRMLPLVVEAVP